MGKSTKTRRRRSPRKSFDLVDRVVQLKEQPFHNLRPDDATIRVLTDQYLRLRETGKRIASELSRIMDQEALPFSGDLLGILHDGVFVLDDENEMAVVFDHAIHNYRRDGKNAVEQYIEQSPPAEGSDEATWLQASRRAFHSIFIVVEVIEGFGIYVRDVLTQEVLLVADVNFSRCVRQGNMLASRVVPLDDFAVLAGAALPIVDPQILVQIGNYLQRVCAKVKDFRNMPRDRAVLLESFITRTCLNAHASQYIAHADPT